MIQTGIDYGKPGGDFSAEITVKYSADGSLHILAFKLFKPLMKPKNGFNMPDGVFPNDIPGYEAQEETVEDYCEEYIPDIDGLCKLCGEPLSKHDD